MAMANIEVMAGQYPQKWSEYIGQDDAKYALRVAAKASKLLGEPLPHILITSPYPGIGKTALALLTIRASERRVHFISGALTIEKAQDMFADAQDGDTCFYDEFHKVMDGGRAQAEWMLNYLVDGVLLTPDGVEEVPRVTFVAATTDKGRILPAILDRFKVVDLEPYTDQQAAEIAAGMSAKVFASAHLTPISDQVALAVARAASNRPRRMQDLLRSLRDLVVCEELPHATDGNYELAQALTFAGYTEDGLTKDARTYLLLLKVGMGGKPIGEGPLKQRLGMVGHDLAATEKLLADKGYITFTTGGRRLTTMGRKRATELAREI